MHTHVILHNENYYKRYTQHKHRGSYTEDSAMTTLDCSWKN